MSKKYSKWVQGLEDLFKSRGETVNKQKNLANKFGTQCESEEHVLSSKHGNLEGKTVNNQTSNGTKTSQSKYKKNNKIQGASSKLNDNVATKSSKPLKKQVKNDSNMVDDTDTKLKKPAAQNKAKKSKISNTKENVASNSHPRGYFVLNHNEPKLEKSNLKQNKKPNKLDLKKKEVNKQNLQEKQTQKRKLEKKNGPARKKKKRLNEQDQNPTNDISKETSKTVSKFRYPDNSDESDYDDYIESTDETDDSEDNSDSGDYEYDTSSDEYDMTYSSDDLDDTYSEQTESENSFSDAYFYNHEEDPDYELPNDEVEDHIVHKGLAVKHELSEDLGIEFDELNESAQIMELPSVVNTVTQHETLDVTYIRAKANEFVEKHQIIESDVEKCPDLVPIDNEDFSLWTSGIEMDDEHFSDYSCEVVTSDDESVSSSEAKLFDKYLNNSETEETTSDSDDQTDNNPIAEVSKRGLSMQAQVIKAKDEPNLRNFQSNTEDSRDSNVKLNLHEIIEQTEDAVLPTNAMIKNVNVNDFPVETAAINAVGPFDNPMEQQQQQPQFEESVIDVCIENSVELNTVECSEKPTNNFKTIFLNSMDSYHVLVLLKSPFYLYGTVKATLIAGCAETFGYTLEQCKTQQLFSPRGLCSIKLQPVVIANLTVEDLERNSKSAITNTIRKYSDECVFNEQQLEKLINKFKPNTDAIVLLERNFEAENIKRMLQEHVKENIFPVQIPQSRPFYTTELLLDCMINTKTEYPFNAPSQWYDKLCFEPNPKLLLVGGKSVGKSTLLRFLVNQQLKNVPAVLIIDLDIGQPELFTSQSVSCAIVQQPLLGPGFLYNLKPEKAYCVANSNVVLCAYRYMSAVLSLLKYCKAEIRYHNMPWIVNTMGYNKGFGAELIAIICEHLRPTDVVQIQSNAHINNFDVKFMPHNIPAIERVIYNREEDVAQFKIPLNYRYHELPSAVLHQGRYQREWQMSAKDLRYVMILTQLSRLLDENGRMLNSSQTFCINMNAIKIANTLASSSKLDNSLTSNLVFLGHTEEETQTESISCYGIGIVRGIDYATGNIFLLSTLQLNEFKKVNSIILGDMPLPASILTLQRIDKKTALPFVQIGDDEATTRSIRQFYARK